MELTPEIEHVIEVQDVFMDCSATSESIREFVHESGMLEDQDGIDMLARSLFLAITYHPRLINMYVEMFSDDPDPGTLVKLKKSLLDVIFHYMDTKIAFPSESGSISFLYRAFKAQVFPFEAILWHMKKMISTDLIHQSVFWLFAYFAPEVEKIDLNLYEDILCFYDNRDPRIMECPPMKAFYDSLSRFRQNNWSLYYDEIEQKNALPAILRSDDISALRQVAAYPEFDINQRIPTSLFEPCWFLQDRPTLVQYAAYHNSMMCFNFLQTLNANLHLTDDKGKTLAHFAVASGQIEIVRTVQQLDCDFRATVHVAACYFWFNLYQWLEGVVDDLESDHSIYGTVLSSAASSGNVKAFFSCFEHGFDINSSNGTSTTPLHFACHTGQVDLIKIILSFAEVKVNSPNFDGSTPLLLAAMNGHSKTVQLLLTHPSIDVNLRGTNEINPLLIATFKGNLHCLQCLLQHPMIDTTVLTDQGYTVLEIATLVQPRLLPILLSCPKIDVNHQGREGNTALHLAVRQNCIKAIDALISSPRINPNLKNFYGDTPLHMAAKNDMIEAAEHLFRRRDVKANIPNNAKQTAYQIAKATNLDMLDLFEEYVPLSEMIANKKL